MWKAPTKLSQVWGVLGFTSFGGLGLGAPHLERRAMCERSMGQDALDDMLVESAGMTEDTWVSSDGRHIKFEDLTDSHLRNIIGYLQRQSAECTAGLTVVNGEQAGYSLEDEIFRIESDLDRLLLECDRRGWSRAAALLGVATSRKERWDEVY